MTTNLSQYIRSLTVIHSKKAGRYFAAVRLTNGRHHLIAGGWRSRHNATAYLAGLIYRQPRALNIVLGGAA